MKTKRPDPLSSLHLLIFSLYLFTSLPMKKPTKKTPIRGNIQKLPQPEFPAFPSLFSRNPLFNFDELFAPFFGGRELIRDIEQESGMTISEDERNVYVEMAVPGIDPKDVEVKVENGVLSVSARTSQEEQDAQKRFYQRSAQSFSYCLRLPESVTETPSAKYRRGMLNLTFEKLPEKQAKKIQIEIEEE